MIIKKLLSLTKKEQNRMPHETQDVTTEKAPSTKSVLTTLFILVLVFTFIAYFQPQ
jgi:hypothetical protein